MKLCGVPMAAGGSGTLGTGSGEDLDVLTRVEVVAPPPCPFPSALYGSVLYVLVCGRPCRRRDHRDGGLPHHRFESWRLPCAAVPSCSHVSIAVCVCVSVCDNAVAVGGPSEEQRLYGCGSNEFGQLGVASGPALTLTPLPPLGKRVR